MLPCTYLGYHAWICFPQSQGMIMIFPPSTQCIYFRCFLKRLLGQFGEDWPTQNGWISIKWRRYLLLTLMGRCMEISYQYSTHFNIIHEHLKMSFSFIGGLILGPAVQIPWLGHIWMYLVAQPSLLLDAILILRNK